GKSQTAHQPAIVPEKPSDTGQWSVAGKGKGKRGGSDKRGEPFRGPAERDFSQKHEGASLKDGQQSHMQQGQGGGQPQQAQRGTQPYEGPSVGATAGRTPTVAIKKLPPRPGLGTRGRPIRLLTNFFKVEIPPDLTLYHYDVVIEPNVPRAIKRKVMQGAKLQHDWVFSGQYPVFDGEKNLYCHKKLERSQVDVEVSMEDRGRTRQFKVVIKYTGHIVECGTIEKVICDPAQRMDALAALDLVLRQGTVLKPDVVSVGQSFFTPSRSNTVTLGDGREVWFGYRQTARPSMWKTVLLNIDIAATAFYKEQPVLEFLKDILSDDLQRDGRYDGGRRGGGRGGRGGGRQDRGSGGHVEVPQQLSEYQRKRFLKEIKGLKIVVTHLSYPRQYKVDNVPSKTASEQTFTLTLDNGQEVERTVERYFADTYNIKLRYPNLPCLHVAAKNKNVYLPLECCKIAKGQRCSKKLTEMQLRNMIRHTAKPAEERRQDILRNVRAADFDSDLVLNQYGLKVHKEMEKVMGRVLLPPAIQYREKNVVPRNGAWNMEHRQFCKGVDIGYWAVAVCAPNRPPPKHEILDFMEKLARHSQSLGMKITEPCDVVFQPRGKAVGRFLEDLVSKYKGLQLIVVILPKKGADSGYGM
ncbi:Protein argonaute-2 (Fragment), partial [Geodia barretti]